MPVFGSTRRKASTCSNNTDLVQVSAPVACERAVEAVCKFWGLMVHVERIIVASPRNT